MVCPEAPRQRDDAHHAYFRLLGMIGMMGTIWHDIMPNGFCMWHDGGMTGSMTVRLSCHSQADT